MCIRDSKYGDLATVKVENMKEQHTSLSVKDDDSSMSAGQTPKTDTTEKKSPEKKYGFVSVAAGDGIRDVFYDLGVDNVVQGGQTMNPSTDDIVNAVNITPSEIVYVLPNNKNIYMAAKLAEEIVEDKQVIVLKTVSIPQGISAMLAFDPEADTDTNTSNMKDSMKTVKTEKMTFAARDSVFENSEIKEGQILGLVENSVTFIENSKEDCMRKLAREIKDYSYITLFYGEESDEAEAQKMADLVKSEIGEDKDILVVNGGQPVYYYIISAE